MKMAAKWDAKDKNFIITGGASGLGAAFAETFLKDGAKNVAILDIDEITGTAFVNGLNKDYDDRAIFIKCDVSKEEEIQSSFETVVNKFRHLDVLVNNAGVMSDSDSTWRLACNINVLGLVSFTLKAVNHMRKDEGGAGGVIVNISSTAALAKLSILPIYCGAKAAVLHFSQSLAMSPFNENTGIRVMTLCPGPTDTKLMRGLKEKIIDEVNAKDVLSFLDTIPKQRVESVVEAIRKLLQDGNNGSIWLCANDKPALEITANIDKYLNDLQKLLLP